MDKESIEIIKDAVKEAFKEELKQFYVDRETHYQHHQFITEWINWTQQCKSIALKTILTFFMAAALGLMTLGFYFKYKG